MLEEPEAPEEPEDLVMRHAYPRGLVVQGQGHAVDQAVVDQAGEDPGGVQEGAQEGVQEEDQEEDQVVDLVGCRRKLTQNQVSI